MHLKNLTIRGFKSFASATSFTFEPGVTAIVGPNGSGKSNVVDALAWVMGEQGAKTLRGGKMEDVIFAGTSGRPPLGRAHVSLTIDNADGALPIDYSEVTISRTLFRTGGSEYAINGTSCRLLDIQELLSDSGLGREMHVIVGQGQLDRILHATPEDRRGFIEEAAGILKHRRRKERTLRKLDAMQGNLQRLSDLSAELRRQLGPLGRQAAVARRAQTVQSELRDAKARLLADDLVRLTGELESDAAREQALRERIAVVEADLAQGREQQSLAEQSAAAMSPRITQARATWHQLTTARERLRGLGQLATERHRLLGSSEPVTRHNDAEQMEQQAVRAREEAARIAAEVEQLKEMLDVVVNQRAEAEALARAEDARVTAALRAAADRRESLATLSGKVGAARSRVQSVEAELGRIHDSLLECERRRATAEAEFASQEAELADSESGEQDLDSEYEQAADALETLEAQDERLAAEQRDAEHQLAALGARIEALRQATAPRDGSARLEGHPGILGSIANAVKVTPGHEAAIAAALGPFAEALVADGVEGAARALEQLKDEDAGRANVLIGRPGEQDGPAGTEPTERPEGAVPADAVPARAVVTAHGPGGEAVLRLLESVLIAETLQAAGRILAAAPDSTVVTREGDVLSAHTASGGSPASGSLLETQTALEETEQRLSTVTSELERLRFARKGLADQLEQARERADAALDRLHESDATLAASAEKLGSLKGQLRSITAEAERLRETRDRAQKTLAQENESLETLAAQLTRAHEDASQSQEGEAIQDQRETLETRAREVRAMEVDARLALRTAEEQLSNGERRAAGLERAAASERRAQQEAVVRAERRRRQAARAAAVAEAARQAVLVADRSVESAAAELARVEEDGSKYDTLLGGLRAGNDALARELAELTGSAHRDQLALTQQRARIEAVEQRAIDELGLGPEELVAEFGPHLPVPSVDGAQDKWAELRQEVDDEGNPIPTGVPFVRAEQEKRLKRAEKDLSSLGKINPLALEEFAALEERHQFLNTQLEDLKASRKDLLDIIKEVDARVQEVFSQAFADTSEQFVHVFGRLFPGGEGRLVLTDPDDMLTTGIEVEARPAGKKIKRLSLLSGGERSLTAVALLVAIFKARPSPFYVMDEVEAALDDVNLGRLITIFEELRESSQLIVITHQKRTMEVADALYGVTMRGDGVTTVISQRMGE
ncbi:chromosome segregation protein SMC [Arthrobacter sp. Y-9]|uniref:chromosome segregation protein SMC n=1 Tax=Arthrobacter sp. Y-9 TaxID=3039385 RepID=UPI00241F5D24|nr:chromosome segregation protein SMC [Arthrobacter sp. Y-9]WFR82915.1 chromosome segregation protein SMC [Arthrobacter sp. Y-9]